MTSSSTDLKKALQENLKLRRELAAEVAEAKGDRLAPLRLFVARLLGAFRYALFGRVKSRPVSAPAAAPVSPPKSALAGRPDLKKRLVALDDAREQQTHRLQQLDRQTDPGECRQRALECVRRAQSTTDPEAKRIWSDLAKTWLTFAADLEANECLFDEWGKPRAKAERLSSGG
ncbi:hypothetical protein [Methyloceanibacter sp.]|uniref:hypothetical protein n=1 Tax=Methyloceanibacter sp. TaxID=1965321 RepID=UPI002D70E470|nr:hypothetical protein [Methyloceanibacter sp.]HZP08358.1 hypothetical protein [Methyloceanibacter sp.]